jgi:membrane fusion protein
VSLFRDEAFRRRAEALHGNINLALPMAWQLIGFGLFLSIVVSIIFLAAASYARTETAQGVLIPEAGIIEIVPTRSGLVSKIFVREGENVAAGAKLAAILVEETGQSGAGSQADVMAALAAQEGSLASQQAMERQAARAEQEGYAAQAAGLQQEIVSLSSQIGSQRELAEIARSDLQQVKEVATRGYISKRDVRVREETLLLRQQQLAALEQARDAKTSSLIQARRAESRAASQAAAAGANLGVNRSALEQQKAEVRAQRGYVLTAPTAGRVAALTIHQGDSVTPPTTAMMIIPARARLTARIYVPSKAIGFVRAGQKVRLSLDAFPFDRFGTVASTIASVSSAPVTRTDAEGKAAPFYLATARLDGTSIHAFGAQQQLLPGMTFNAKIVTRKRSLLAWLFEPLLAARR